jgi:protein-disulfide isomerase
MKKSFIALATASALLFSSVSLAELTKEQQQQLADINKLLESNPEVIANLHQSLAKYVDGQALLEKAKAENHDWLYNTKDHSITGNPDGKTVLINFTDYNCPYCKKLEAGIEQLVKEYDDVKVINIIVPLQQQQVKGLDTNSAVYSLKVWQEAPESFQEVHNLLVAKNGRHTKDSLEKIAKKTNTEKLLVEDSEIQKTVMKNYRAFNELGLGGTPAIFIGDQIIPGFIPYTQLKELVAKEMESNG